MNYSSRLEGLQLPLLLDVDPYPIRNFRLRETFAPIPRESPIEGVLGGDEDSTDSDDEPKKLPAHGWLKWKPVVRKRKSGVDWQTDQLWFYWEEAGGQKRSRYVPRRKEDEVIESVRALKRSIEETLKLLEKTK